MRLLAKRNTYFQDEEIERKIDIHQFGRILKYMMPYKKTVILVLILMIISSVTAMITPLLLRTIIDQVVVSDEYKTLALLISGMAALAVLEIGVTLIHQRHYGCYGTQSDR